MNCYLDFINRHILIGLPAMAFRLNAVTFIQQDIDMFERFHLEPENFIIIPANVRALPVRPLMTIRTMVIQTGTSF